MRRRSFGLLRRGWSRAAARPGPVARRRLPSTLGRSAGAGFGELPNAVAAAVAQPVSRWPPSAQEHWSREVVAKVGDLEVSGVARRDAQVG